MCMQTDGILICTSDSSQNAKCEVLTIVTTQITAVCDVTLQHTGGKLTNKSVCVE